MLIVRDIKGISLEIESKQAGGVAGTCPQHMAVGRADWDS